MTSGNLIASAGNLWFGNISLMIFPRRAMYFPVRVDISWRQPTEVLSLVAYARNIGGYAGNMVAFAGNIVLEIFPLLRFPRRANYFPVRADISWR